MRWRERTQRWLETATATEKSANTIVKYRPGYGSFLNTWNVVVGGGGGGGGLKIRLDCGARAAVFRVRGPLDLSAWGSGKGGGSGTRVSQCHGIFQSLCSGFIWCMWWKLKSPQLNISFGNSLSPKKYLWNRSPGPSPSASPGLGKCVLPSAFSFKRNSLKVKKRQNLSCFLEAPKFVHASLLCLFDDVKL